LSASYDLAFSSVRIRESRGIVNACWLLTGAIALWGLTFSRSPFLWMFCVVCLPLALELAGGRKIRPIAAAFLGLFWAAIFLSILTADLNLQSLDEIPWESTAIVNSLLALFAIALGYRFGARAFYHGSFNHSYDVPLNPRKVLISYWCAFFLAAGLTGLAAFVPSFTQGILALKGIELLLLYMFAAQSFASGQNYAWLLTAVVAEIVLGSIGYIASYQLPLIVVLAAAINSSSSRWSPDKIVIGALFASALLYVSVVWTAIKADYRFWLENGDPQITGQTGERIQWIWNRIDSGSINYRETVIRLANRIGYTRFYAVALPRMETSSYEGTSYWLLAIENVLKPRFLFPDKPALDDTKITAELTGFQFGPSVSVSTGFVAQAHSDFGFPLMYAPITLVGFLMGAIGGYFQSRKASVFAKDGFMAAALVYKFTYESNIDKAIGGLLLSTLALLATFWLLYPSFERWAREDSP
jgi:hypothetical protein